MDRAPAVPVHPQLLLILQRPDRAQIELDYAIDTYAVHTFLLPGIASSFSEEKIVSLCLSKIWPKLSPR